MRIKQVHADYVVFGGIIILLILLVSGQLTQASGLSMVVIDNADPNSMFPTYFQGDLFVLHRVDPERISIGDVIVYVNLNEKRVIHRVIDIVTNASGYFYRVKGDDPVTNPIPDYYGTGWLIPYNVVMGKIIARAPYIGHISVALDHHLGLKIMMLVLGGVAIAIIYFLDTEDEDLVDNYYTINRIKFRNLFGVFKEKTIKPLKYCFASKYKFLSSLIIITVLITGFTPFLLPAFVPQTYHSDRGIITVRYEQPSVKHEDGNNNDFLFANVFITFYDDGNLLNYINSYVMQVHDPSGHLVDETKWNTLRPILGQFTIGGTITIDLIVIDQLLAAGVTTVLVTIIPHVRDVAHSHNLETYEFNFTIDYS